MIRYGKQCISAAKRKLEANKQTEQWQKQRFLQKLESLRKTDFSYTSDRLGVIDLGRQFSLSRDGAPLAISTLADRQHSGNDRRWMSLRKIMLIFGAIISATIFRNRGNTLKASTHPYVSSSRSRRRRTGVRRT